MPGFSARLTAVAHLHTPAARRVPRVVRERRWWLLPLALWALASVSYYRTHLGDLRSQMEQVAIEGARNMFRMVVLTRNWNSSHGGVYVPVTPRTPPNPYLDHPRRDLLTTDGTALTMINPAYMTRLIGEMVEADAGAVFRLTSLKPVRPQNGPDDWERRALTDFEGGLNETWGIEVRQGQPWLRYMAPLKVRKSCLECHARQGYREGDIRGGISVSQDYTPIADALESTRREVGWMALATFVGVALLGWCLLELLRRRWLELAGKVDELAAAQVQLLQSEKLAGIGQLAAGVAHEINNPLGFVKSNLHTLGGYVRELLGLLEAGRKAPLTEADYARIDYDYLRGDIDALLEESRTGLGRVQRIVADLRHFASAEQTGREPTDLNARIESTLNVAASELQQHAVLIRDLGELPPVPCVAAEINQVVMNLLLNAVQALDGPGTITLRTRRVGDDALIEVADTGRGIPSEHLERIFDPFFTTQPVGQGTGLGLALSYDIVKKHGGRIEVESRPGEGSCFRVFLPLA